MLRNPVIYLKFCNILRESKCDYENKLLNNILTTWNSNKLSKSEICINFINQIANRLNKVKTFIT